MTNVRDLIFERVSSDSIMNGLGFDTNNLFNSNDADTPNVRPFMVFRWGATSPGMDIVRKRILQIWVHDEPSDYSTIDTALNRVRDILTSLFGVNVDTTSKWVLQIDWELDSDDLSDDIQRTVTRYSQFSVVGSAS
jgi:hypothetical protein